MPESPSPELVQATAEHLLTVLNHGSLTLMISLGHQAGLFDAMLDQPSRTSADIAARADLNERYVREWLGAMTVGGIVQYDSESETYLLRPEYGALLTRAAGPDNLANFAQMLPMFAEVEQDILECFRRGGGVPYRKYARFHRRMAELSAATNDVALISVIVPLVPGLDERLRAGIDVADIGCGSGHAMNLLARAYPASRFIGYDFSEEAVGTARGEAAAAGLRNSSFEVRDVAELGEVDRFDFITAFDAIHDQARPADVLACISRALKADGDFLMADIQASSQLEDNISHPLGPMLYTTSTMHCMTVSLALGGAGLGTVWGEQRAVAMLGDAGFAHVDIKHVDADLMNSYYVARKTG